MSELIDNRRHRIEALKSMIHELHGGAAVDDLKTRFRAVLDHAGAAEISAMESELMAEGMEEGEIKRMCELHVAVFREALEQRPPAEAQTGHPVHTFRRENQVALETVAEYRELLDALRSSPDRAALDRWRRLQERLALLDSHYKRKEFLVFPFLEKAGITAPPKVMWSLDDEIREQLRAASELAAGAGSLAAEDIAVTVEVVLEPLLNAVEGMVEKEERVLWPMATEHLSEGDWGEIQQQWHELGEGLARPEQGWTPAAPRLPERPVEVPAGGAIVMPSGTLTLDQLVGLLNTLPVDLTFVDADDRVAFFSEGRERVFARNRAIIGRSVQNCHPPASVHIVERVLADLRSGARDVAEFWIQMHGRFVHIRYFAVRQPTGEYLGCLEVTQDATRIRALDGERRLLAETTGGLQ